jgi:alkylation response protein AidB-like acyl-CoA dehydrogenase
MHGSEQQKESFLPPTLSGEISWCQGFSEPGAGSDLASLQTRAVGDGDDFLINGHKTWISGAHQASWMYMLARTDPDAPKHKGITYFLVDMKSPGLTTRPIVNIVGESGFDDVFFDGVRVPRENIVGEINRGWYVATTTLDFERSAIGLAIGVEQSVEDLIRYVRENPELTIGRNPRLRHSLADRWIESQVAILFSYRIFTMQNRGLIPNQEASAQKLYTSELTQRITRTAMETLGLHGPLFGDRAPLEGRWARSYLGTTSSTIAGGTSEIQRNIIALRGLGLPRG